MKKTWHIPLLTSSNHDWIQTNKAALLMVHYPRVPITTRPAFPRMKTIKGQHTLYLLPFKLDVSLILSFHALMPPRTTQLRSFPLAILSNSRD